MSKIILEKLIYRNYLKTALTSILFIELALIIIYFSANNSILNATTEFLLKDIKKNVYTLVSNITSNVEHKFDDIESLTYILQDEHQTYFKYQDDIEIEDKPEFQFASNGMYYKVKDNGGASVVVSNTTKITKDIEKKLVNTEIFDSTFKRVVRNNEMIIAAYFNSHDNINRYYPFIEDSFNAFPSSINMTNYNFYYEADKEHNPKKEVVWTDVYLDPAGQGWMLSVIAPIYNGEFLEGVTGIDVTVKSIIDRFLNFELPYKGSSFLIDSKGNVVAMTEEIADILNIKDDLNYIYKEKIEKTILKEDSYNIFNSIDNEFSDILKSVIEKKKYEHEVSIDENKFLLFTEHIKKVDWFLVSLIDEKEVLSNVNELEEYYKCIGYLIILFIVIFYFLFFIYLYSKAKDFVKKINTPLLNMIKLTKTLGTKKNIKKLEHCGIEEIDTLSDNFNALASELDLRTEKLIESETKREHHEKMANTDALTKVYNRRFLEDFSNKYMKIVKRENKTLSLLLVDIDKFKNINDTHGHDIGDKIIINLVERIKKVIRENDIIVRLGGDEFVILLPSTNIKNARNVAKKLVVLINTINQLEKEELTFTISIGVSEYKKEDNKIDDLIKRADEALYEAKRQGRNRVI